MIKKFFSYLKWLWKGKPVITYDGFNCGCCGEWIYEKYTIPTYKSAGRWGILGVFVINVLRVEGVNILNYEVITW